MIKFRIIGHDGQNKIVGVWQRDVPVVIQRMCAVWIERRMNFTVEFAKEA